MTETRRLAAIMAVDVVGYSRLMGEDEVGTAQAVLGHRDAARPIVSRFGGRIVKTMGDGLLLEFPSVVAAVDCAVTIQKLMVERNAETPESRRIVYRIGVHLSDVLVDGDDILGEGVNIAARLEGIAEPGGICISASAMEHVDGRVDAAFEDIGDQNLKNIARPVRAYALRNGDKIAEPTHRSPLQKPSGPPRLSIVVLPFANLGGGPDQDYFADGVTESLTTDLSRIKGAFVIARNSAFTYKNRAVDLKQVGRELNVRYALEGSVQRSSVRMRINVQLIETETARHLWAERFDKPIVDLFAMQDEIVARLAEQIGAHLVAAEARRAERKLDPDSMELYFQGRACLNNGATNQNLMTARDYFRRALERDSGNLSAIHGFAQVDAMMATLFMVDDRQARFASSEKTMAHLLLLEPNDARFHFTMGFILVFTKRGRQGMAEYERALELDTNLAGVHAQIGNAKFILGKSDETEGHVQEAFRLSPKDNAAFVWAQFIANAKMALEQYREATLWLRRSIEMNGGYSVAHFLLAAALVLLEDIEEGRAAARTGLAVDPRFTIHRYMAGVAGDDPTYLTMRQRVAEALRKVDIPEGAP